jgi:group II intron reverse transcriptase/maturase
MHHITPQLLRSSYLELNRQATPGVDEETWKAYGTQAEARLQDLHERLHSGRYRAKPSRRIYLPKPDGKKRPIGIAALEDKIAQQAVVTVLNQIYETDFLPFSHGFRPGRKPHDALDALWVAITRRKVSWIVDADIRSFFDTIDHDQLLRMLAKRIGDERLLRLIRKWLRAGVSEEGQWSPTRVGTPQGAVISPLLANVYLHYVLDLWVQWWRTHEARGEVIIVRYADDFVMGFQYESDARRWLKAARDRMGAFGLELHEAKTRLIEFGRFAADNRRRRGEGKPETFDFLGFTHICSKRRKDGKFTVRRQTIVKRMNAKLKEVTGELKRRMHEGIKRQGRWLRQVVRGHMNYYGVPGNSQGLNTFRTEIVRRWFKALRRRSQRGKRLTWERMKGYARAFIPPARLTQPYPNERLLVR